MYVSIYICAHMYIYTQMYMHISMNIEKKCLQDLFES